MDTMQVCPCGTNTSFEQCCYRYISGQQYAPSPEALMRSRYSAYATKHFAYVARTYLPQASQLKDGLPATEKAVTENDIAQASEDTRWCKLAVLSAFEHGNNGEVEFIAYYQHKNQFAAMHELSSFTKHDQKWFYAHGTVQPLTGIIKQGRNDLCLCGSGLKFKRCCQR